MMKYKVAVIRVVTIEDEEKRSVHGRLIEKYVPEIETTSYSIPDQYSGVYDDETHAIAEKKVVELGIKLEKDFDGIIVSCAGDPGVEKLQAILRKPVVGAGHSLAMLAHNTGKKIGVLGIREEAPDALLSSLGDKISISKKIKNVNNTIELNTKAGEKNAVITAMEIEKEGVGVILLACTGMATTGISTKIKENIFIPVIDPVLAESLVMYSMLRLK